MKIVKKNFEKKSFNAGERIEALRKKNSMDQAQLAEYLDVSRSTVSAWEIGTTVPPAEAWLRLAVLMKDRKEIVEAFQAAHISERVIVEAAKALGRKFSFRPKKGETIDIPRFRETSQGRENAGTDVPLPQEFIPNPGSTVCLVVDDEATAVVNCPGGLMILDESDRDAPDLNPFWGQAVLARYDGTGIEYAYDSGIYAGRLSLAKASHGLLFLMGARFDLLTGPLGGPANWPNAQAMWLGRWADKTAPPLEIPLREVDGEPHFAKRENPAVMAAWRESIKRARSDLRLHRGWRIMGRLYGRLHLKGVKNDAWSLQL